jgi:CheY-like chemotaxis protein
MPHKVLTVDDSKTIRMIVKKAFKPYDCELIEAENGKIGLDTAAREKPDLIILDITMPVMTGIEMLEKLKGNDELKSVPVIMLTAESGKDNVMQIVKMGVQNYIVKPFKGEQLIERVRGVLALDEKAGKADANSAEKYFKIKDSITILKLPPKITRPIGVEVEGMIGPRLKDMKADGLSKFILDLTGVQETNMSLIKLIVQIIEKFGTAKIHTRVAGSAALKEELQEFAETSSLPIHDSLEAAKSQF